MDIPLKMERNINVGGEGDMNVLSCVFIWFCCCNYLKLWRQSFGLDDSNQESICHQVHGLSSMESIKAQKKAIWRQSHSHYEHYHVTLRHVISPKTAEITTFIDLSMEHIVQYEQSDNCAVKDNVHVLSIYLAVFMNWWIKFIHTHTHNDISF